MSQNVNLELTVNYPRLVTPLEGRAEVIEVELADRILKRGLLGQFSSSQMARTVAAEVISLLKLSLIAGDLSVFRSQMQWEIGVAINHHRLNKLDSDVALIVLLREILLEQLNSTLEYDIKALCNQLRNMCIYCWKEAEQEWQHSHRAN